MLSEPFAFITGAAGGIGRSAAEHFHQQGYRLWLCDRDKAGLDKMATLYPSAKLDSSDLSDVNALEALCQSISSSLDNIAIAFVNAGVIKPGEAANLERSTIDFHIDVNLRASAYLSQALSQHMVKRKQGHIIGTLSAAGLIALPGSAAYAASKFGFRGYLLSLAQEVRSAGVYVSCIYPNAIDTPMLRYEALNGGSVLNFLSKPSSTDEVINAIKRAEKGKRLEYFVPRSDVLLDKFVTVFPGVMRPLLPLLNKLGEKGRKKFIARIHD